MKHIMIDLETMSTAKNAAIVAIGAVEFDPATGELGETFYCNVDLGSCMEAGLDVEADTVMWWMSRSDKARARLQNDRVPLRGALADFTTFMTQVGGYDEVAIWGNGSDFDNAILQSAYRALDTQPPWNYRNNRDVRTILALAPEATGGESHGVKHDALGDAVYQAKCVSRAWQVLWNR